MSKALRGHALAWRALRACAAGAIAVLLAACGTPAPVGSTDGGATPARPGTTGAAGPSAGAKPLPAASGEVLGRNDRLMIYQAKNGDTLRSIATAFLGDESQHWVIGDANGVSKVEPGQVLIVPLKPLNITGVAADQFQTVPILCYHRFGAGNAKMLMSPSNFQAQLEWLARNDYQVIRLAQLQAWMEGRQPLPKKAVVITIDDGYESVHRHAFPLLRKYGFTATLFVYTDFVGYGDALSWAQLQEMASSGVIDIQAHSKSHRNLIDRFAGETDERYKQNIEAEVRTPREVLEKRLTQVKVTQYAYPFGDANEQVLDNLTRQQYQLGVTVNPGGNGFFAQPLMLRRTMIFGDLDLEGFKAKLQISRSLATP